ncbi:RNP-1 like RNA-binding protein [candidate division TM7 genomosp. GTL1]|nr:RNP-1 like RNA-binding protein [candidate division TM7 genomosp. GTL1]
MSKKLFIGSLAYATTDDSLRAHFAEKGEVEEAKVVTDRDSGRSKGFGFVTYVNDEDADTAIKELDNSELDGRNIHVNEARPREERPRNGGFNGNGGSGGGGSFRQRQW